MTTIVRLVLAAAAAVLTLGLNAAPAQPLSPDAADQAFLAQNRPAMDRMMAGMDIRPSHDVDRDFAAMMIPHHQGAIDMARAELIYGKDERLRRLAQGIIVEQNQEIVVMRQILAERPVASSPLPPQRPNP